MSAIIPDLTVGIEPSCAAAEAVQGVFESLGARVSLAPGAASLPNLDIVISDRPSGAKGTCPVWLVLTENRRSGPRNEYRTCDPSLGFGPVADMLTAAHAVLVALAGLAAAGRTGQTSVAHVAMNEVMATCVIDLLLPELCGAAPLPHRSAEERTMVVPCSDGAVSITLTTEEDRADLAEMIGLGESPNGPDQTALASWAHELTREQIVAVGQSWRLPVLPVITRKSVAATECAMNPFDCAGALGPRASRPSRSDCRQLEALRQVPPRAYKASGSGRARRPRSQDAGPLDGLRVLDLGMVWAGPYCGRLLAGLGAEVIKVEGPRRRDGTRPPDGWSGCSGFFGDLNRGKASLVVDLATRAGREVFLECVRNADVILESFSPRVMPNFELDYASLTAVNPELIQLSMPAFASDGDYAQYVGYGSGMELAVGLGIPSTNGLVAPPVPYLDLLSGAFGAIAVVSALLRRNQTLSGCRIEVAQHAVARHLASGCPDDLWADRRPCIDGDAIVQGLIDSGLFSTARQDGYCQHLARCPWTVDSTARDDHPAPRFGADSERVLRDLAGLPSSDIARLIRDGVVVSSEPGGLEE